MQLRLSGAIVLESRYIEPFAKNVAAMLHLEVAVGGRYITFGEDRTKGARKMCVNMLKHKETLRLTLPTKSEDRSVAHCHLVGKCERYR